MVHAGVAIATIRLPRATGSRHWPGRRADGPVRPRSARLTRGSFARWALRSSRPELGSPLGLGVFPEIADHLEHDRWDGAPTVRRDTSDTAGQRLYQRKAAAH